ncbi:NitT/TauT family transport system permease protein [Herbihabitans rhizosphaerae]|uniref:NitT/TauT family transport system permease protein n=1 Tax=Herbihabitans rhizosphaerae TaxID=1872711 RepID=A0A4Q7KXL7_9PSEU|nr:ABC transporter permease [Herbihabitans rhizosphaerae]RZS41070.1 NitT/TauT family transport system permease protein [Herbihabitans rhizosphaerae]
MRVIRSLVGLGVFFALWEIIVRADVVRAVFLPPPSTVFARLGDLLGSVEFLRDVQASLLAWLIALLIATGVAVPAGLLLGSIPGLRSATRVLVEFLRPIPSVALIPPVLIMVGAGSAAKITLAVYAAVWPILFNTMYALSEIDPLLRDTAKSFGTKGLRLATSVSLPHAAPFVFTGLRMSAAISLIVVISTEYLAGATRGVGRFILEATEGAGRMDLVLAGTLVVGAIGYLINEGLERLGGRLFRWSTVEQGAA